MKSVITMALVFTSLAAFSQSKDDKRVMADAKKAMTKMKSMDIGLD